MRPTLVEAWLPLLMQAVVDWDVVLAGCGDDLVQVGDGVMFFEGLFKQIVQLAVLVEEVVVEVYEDNG